MLAFSVVHLSAVSAFAMSLFFAMICVLHADLRAKVQQILRICKYCEKKVRFLAPFLVISCQQSDVSLFYSCALGVIHLAVAEDVEITVFDQFDGLRV